MLLRRVLVCLVGYGMVVVLWFRLGMLLLLFVILLIVLVLDTCSGVRGGLVC